MRTLVIAGEYPWPENTGLADPVGHGPARPATVRTDRAVLGGLQVPRGVRPTRPSRWSWPRWAGSDSTTDRRRPSAWCPPSLRPVDAASACPGGTGPRAAGPGPVHVRPLRPGLVLRAAPVGAGRQAGVRADRPRPRRPGGREDPGPAVRPRPPRRRSAPSGSGGPGPPWCPRTRSVGGADCTDGAAGARRRGGVQPASMPSGPSASGVQQVEVIANGYPAVARPVGRVAVGTPAHRPLPGPAPVPAQHRRGPVAGRTRSGPALRALVPDVEIRLVGEHPPELDGTGRPSPGHGDRPGARHGDRAGPGRRGGGAGPLRQRHQAQDPRGVRPAGPGGVDHARRRGARRRGRRPPAARATPPRTWPRPVPACCASPSCGRRWCPGPTTLFLEHFQSEVIEQEVARLARGGGRRRTGERAPG